MFFADVPKPPCQPKVQDLKGTSTVLTWETKESTDVYFSLEACRLRSSEPWTVIKTNIHEGLCVVDNLRHGETYSFRVICHAVSGEASEPSSPSNPLTIPLQDAAPSTLLASRRSSTSNSEGSSAALDHGWQRDFERKYIELEELGRGRFSVVRKCQEILSGTEVAVKFINRRKQPRDDTQKEYDILSSISHPNLIHSTGLFLTATSDAIVLSL